MKDEELFQLCKDVYKYTDWRTGQCIRPFTGQIKVEGRDLFTGGETVLYNTDYILEMLPASIENKEHGYHWRLKITSMKTWFSAAYENELFVRIHMANELRSDESLYTWGNPSVGDTPLKALLKLTIALHEAGELK